MAMGIVSDDDFADEREIHEKHNNKIAVIKDHVGSGNNRTENVGPSVRKIISEVALEEGNKSAEKTFGVSASSVTAYKNGSTSSATIGVKKDKDLSQFVSSTRERIVRKASRRLNLSLDGITPDKLANASLRESSAVARDMAAIIREMAPSDENNGNKMNVQFVLHAPAIRKESDYEVIDVTNE